MFTRWSRRQAGCDVIRGPCAWFLLAVAGPFAALAWLVPPTHTIGDEPSVSSSDAPDRADRRDLTRQVSELAHAANQCYQEEDYATALLKLERLLGVYRQLYPPEEFPDGHARLVGCYRDLCRVSSKQRDYKALMRWSQEGLEMCRRLYSPDKFPHGHGDLASMTNNVGTAYFKAGNPHKARTYYFEVANILNNLRPISPELDCGNLLSETYDSVARTFDCEGRFGEAVEYAQKALDEFSDSTAAQSAPTSYQRLSQQLFVHGTALRKVGRYAESMPLLTQSLDNAVRVYIVTRSTEDCAHIVDILVESGIVLLNLGNLADARCAFERAVVTLQHHPEIADDAASEPATVVSNLLMVAVAEDRPSGIRMYGRLLEKVGEVSASAEGDTLKAFQIADVLRNMG